ncbi:hypothetical protein ACVGVM_25120 [Pseudonocardia bannensis]|uniref:Uncharacterized protein n=1 Tax=Pseudonocardia bannensis TaxID=630973 RepID=A0A848DQ41_9PSEU|nr:hypothetical protein [Pseudonocardia bannensis]NMH94556.1 hypothetical protein [Pseudonocardia bannensis]
MSTQQMTVALVVLAGLGLISVWTSGARAGRKAERVVHTAARRSSTAGRGLLVAALIVGVQWAVIAFAPPASVIAVVLGVPALFAGGAVARLFTVPEVAPRSLGRGGVHR